ncbi:MAG: hypothetical protein ACTIJ6_12060 [Leucobacter sp.]
MRFRVGVVAVTVLVAATTLVGCTSDEQPDSPETANEKVVEIQDQPGSVEGYVGALEDAKVTICEMQNDVLHVAGTVQNPETDPQDYRIYVSALEGKDTVGLVQVDVLDVGGEISADWSTDIPYISEDLECVLRVERFATQ